jgi:AAA+ superfamily predicted ATPase
MGNAPNFTTADLESGFFEEKKKIYTQWVRNGPGFIPSVEGYSKVEPGCYSLVWSNDHVTMVNVPLVNDDLIALPDSKSDSVITEINKFWGLKANYEKLRYAWKRGFLLHGPPGSGKTATIITVCQNLIKDGGMVIMVNKAVSINETVNFFRKLRQIEAERRLIVIMEDLDTLIKEHGESEMLSLLDGESSISGVVFLATTNYPEDLDGRVKDRPSRFDRVVQIDAPSEESRRIYFKSRMKDSLDADIERYVKATKGMSMAHCKELIIGMLCLEETFEFALERIKGMAKFVSSEDNGAKGKTGFAGFGKD